MQSTLLEAKEPIHSLYDKVSEKRFHSFLLFIWALHNQSNQLVVRFDNDGHLSIFLSKLHLQIGMELVLMEFTFRLIRHCCLKCSSTFGHIIRSVHVSIVTNLLTISCVSLGSWQANRAITSRTFLEFVVTKVNLRKIKTLWAQLG